MFKTLTLAASALALAACSYPDTLLAQDHGDHAHHADHAAAATGPALWQLSDEDTTIYLFGTVHVLPEGTNWYTAPVAAAFESSDEVVFEIKMEEMTSPEGTAAMQSMAMLEGGQTLRSLMSEVDRAEYEAALQSLGIPAMAFDPVEPWAATLSLAMLPLMQAGYNPMEGVEMVLTERAEGKQINALETMVQQIGFFDNLPMEKQLELLDATVEAVPEAAATIDAMVAEWIEGDADGLAAIMNEEMEDSDLYDLLLVNRNANWVEWIEARLDQPGTVFIAVGAGHLAGEGSVQDLLAQRGITTTRVAY